MDVNDIDLVVKQEDEENGHPKWLYERDTPLRSNLSISPSSITWFVTVDYCAKLTIIVLFPWVFIEGCSEGMHPAGYIWFFSYLTIMYLVEWSAFRPVAKPRKGTVYHYLKWVSLVVIDFVLTFKMFTQWFTIIILSHTDDTTLYQAALAFGILNLIPRTGYIMYALGYLRSKVEYYDICHKVYPVLVVNAKPALAHLLLQADLYKKGLTDILHNTIRIFVEDIPFIAISSTALGVGCSETMTRGLLVLSIMSLLVSLASIGKALYDRTKILGYSEAVEQRFTNRTVVDLNEDVNYHRSVKMIEKEILNSSELQEIQFSNKNANQLQLWILVNSLLNNQRLVFIDVSGFERQFSNLIAQKVTYLVKHNDSLRHLDIGYNDLDADSLANIFGSLNDNSVLRTLRTGGQRNMGNIGTRSLADLFRNNHSIHEIDISYNKLESNQVDYILVSIAEVTVEFDLLDITGNTYEQDHISEFIKLNPSILIKAEAIEPMASTLRSR